MSWHGRHVSESWTTAEVQNALKLMWSLAVALFELAKKANATAPIDGPPAPAVPQVYLGEQFVNNITLSDVTFLVENRKFYAHRIALLASSDTFRAMFDGHYREKEASTIPIPNIRFCVFEAMMHCIYTGDCPPLIWSTPVGSQRINGHFQWTSAMQTELPPLLMQPVGLLIRVRL